VQTPNASLRGVTVAPDGDLWFTENAANKIGRMSPDGRLIGEYSIPGDHCGARAIVAIPDGRLFFSAHDADAIGEVVPRRC
jgi:virginiamycin B lyase